MDDGNYLSIMFNKGFSQGTKEEAWNVEFFRNNSQEVTGEGDAQRVFATVLSALQTFIKKYKPNRVIFSASKDNWAKQQQNSESRASLYDRLVQRYAKAWGFRAFRADAGDKVIYELSRIKGVKEDNTMQYAAEKTPAVNPYGGMKDRQFRGSIGEGRRNWDNWKSSATDLPTLLNAFMMDLNRYFKDTVVYSNSDNNKTVLAKVRGQLVATFDKETKKGKLMIEGASGYIPSNAEKNDPRFKTALTVDINPYTMKKDAKKFGNKISRVGIPPTLNPSGKF
jgi:hypothetical protein